jgi:hypothetical protein
MAELLRDNRGLVLILCLIAALWGVLGWMDLKNQTQIGFSTDGNNTITQVYPGSPAEDVGLQPGDYIESIDGIPSSDAATLARQPRAKVGDSRSYTISREGQRRIMLVQHVPLLDRAQTLARVATLIGFGFLVFPMLALFRKQDIHTQILALMGVGLGMAFMGGPWIEAYGIRSVTLSIQNLFVFIGLAALLHFLLVFPHARPFIEKSYARKLLYLPAFVLWVLIAYRLIFTPTASTALNVLTNALAGLIIGGYLLLSLFMMLRNYSRTSKDERKALRLNLMLWGSVFGLLPVTVAQLVSVVSPQTVLPGQDFYFVTLALIPMTWSWSASLK